MFVTLKLSKNQAHKRLLPVKGNKKISEKKKKNSTKRTPKKTPEAGFSLGRWPVYFWPWVKGIQISSNEGSHLFPRGDNY